MQTEIEKKKDKTCFERGIATQEGSNTICTNKELCINQGPRVRFARFFCKDPGAAGIQNGNGKAQQRK